MFALMHITSINKTIHLILCTELNDGFAEIQLCVNVAHNLFRT